MQSCTARDDFECPPEVYGEIGKNETNCCRCKQYEDAMHEVSTRFRSWTDVPIISNG